MFQRMFFVIWIFWDYRIIGDLGGHPKGILHKHWIFSCLCVCGGEVKSAREKTHIHIQNILAYKLIRCFLFGTFFIFTKTVGRLRGRGTEKSITLAHFLIDGLTKKLKVDIVHCISNTCFQKMSNLVLTCVLSLTPGIFWNCLFSFGCSSCLCVGRYWPKCREF